MAAEFDATEFASFADACGRFKRLMFTAPQHDTTPATEDHTHHVNPRSDR